jgi:hypothetical protein
LFDFDRNGDRYEGYWVLDKRQGHGELYCSDGTFYAVSFIDFYAAHETIYA